MDQIYQLIFEKQPQKYMLKMPFYFARKIKKQLNEIANNIIEDKNIVKIQGEKDTYRLRIGDYRITYLKLKEILIIKVVEVKNRGDAYKKI